MCLRRFTIRPPPSAVLLLNATSPANFNKSSSLFSVLQSASCCCCPFLLTGTNNVSSSSGNSFTSCFIAPTPVLLKAGSPTNTTASSVSENEVSASSSCSVEWMKEIRSDTKKFDEYLKPETTEIPSDFVREFCAYLEDFVLNKHFSKSEKHVTLARDALLWLSRLEHRATLARDAFVWLSKFIDAESAEKLCECVYEIIHTNPETNRILFGTASVRDAMVNVAQYCTTSDSAYWFCVLASHLAVNDNNRILFGTASVRDAMIAVSKYCADPDSAYSFCASIVNLAAKNENNRILFGTASVRDALLAMSKYCTDPDSAYSFCASISNLAFNEDNNQVSLKNGDNKVLFGTVSVRDAILSASAYIDDCYGVYTCCGVIYLFHKTNPTLFCVEETITSLLKLSKIEIQKQSPESIYCFLFVVLKLLRSNKKLYSVEIRAAVERFQEVVNDPDQVEKLEKKFYALNALSNEEFIDEARRLCIEFQFCASSCLEELKRNFLKKYEADRKEVIKAAKCVYDRLREQDLGSVNEEENKEWYEYSFQYLPKFSHFEEKFPEFDIEDWKTKMEEFDPQLECIGSFGCFERETDSRVGGEPRFQDIIDGMTDVITKKPLNMEWGGQGGTIGVGPGGFLYDTQFSNDIGSVWIFCHHRTPSEAKKIGDVLRKSDSEKKFPTVVFPVESF